MSTPSTLNNVRNYKNFGLVVYGNTADPILTKGWISSNPNILVQGTTCYLDYSHVYNTSDLVFLKKTFGRFSSGTTFSIPSSQYYDQEKSITTTLGGTLNYRYNLNNGKIVVSSINSGFTFSSSYNFYSKDNFVDTPQYVFSNTGFTGNFVLNTFPNKNSSFEEMGFLGNQFNFEEYIDFSGATSTNYGRLKIDGFAKLKDGQEILYTVSGTTFQNLTDSQVQLKSYIRGVSDVTEIQEPENITGIYRIQDASSKIVNCFEKQNYYQVYLRNQSLGSTYNGYWINCDTCPDDVYSEGLVTEGSQTNLVFDNSVYLFINKIVNTVVNSTVASSAYAVYTQRLYSGSAQVAARLSFSISQALKIDLSHASLQGWKFDIFMDPQYTIPLSSNLVVSGQPGYNQAFVLVQSKPNTPRTLYCLFQGPQTLTFVINI